MNIPQPEFEFEFEQSISDYELLVEKNILIENILNKEQLHILDRLILDTIHKNTKPTKIAFVIGQVLNILKKDNQLYFFTEFKEHSDLLINQRISYLEKIFRIKVNGDVRAMRFSEVILFTPNLLLLEQTLYLLRFENNEDKSLSFNMSDIMISGLKEQLRLQGQEVNDDYIKEQILALMLDEKVHQEVQRSDTIVSYYLREGACQLKQQIKYGNKNLEAIYHYINNIFTEPHYEIPSIKNLCEAFPTNHTIDLPQTVSTNNQLYTLNKVTKEHKTGSTIACVSMITGLDYSIVLNQAKELFNWPKNRSNFYLSIDKIQELLSYYKVNHKDYIACSFWDNCSDLALCVVDVDNTGKYTRAVVFFRKDNKEYIIDPESDNPVRIDFYNMRLEGFINIV